MDEEEPAQQASRQTSGASLRAFGEEPQQPPQRHVSSAASGDQRQGQSRQLSSASGDQPMTRQSSAEEADRALRAIRMSDDPAALMMAMEKEIVRLVGSDRAKKLAQYSQHRAAIDRAVAQATAHKETDEPKKVKRLDSTRSEGSEEGSDEEDSPSVSSLDSEPKNEDELDIDIEAETKSKARSRNHMNSIMVKDPRRTDLLQGATDQEGAERAFVENEFQDELEGLMVQRIHVADTHVDAQVLNLLPQEVSDRLVEDYKAIQVYFRNKMQLLNTRQRQTKTFEKKPTVQADDNSSAASDKDDNDEEDPGSPVNRKTGVKGTRRMLPRSDSEDGGPDSPKRQSDRMPTAKQRLSDARKQTQPGPDSPRSSRIQTLKINTQVSPSPGTSTGSPSPRLTGRKTTKFDKRGSFDEGSQTPRSPGKPKRTQPFGRQGSMDGSVSSSAAGGQDGPESPSARPPALRRNVKRPTDDTSGPPAGQGSRQASQATPEPPPKEKPTKKVTMKLPPIIRPVSRD
eukprot:TRINITY_DN7387_c0_g1_i2.p1 TRINITY_DN7387_c0_g1~~TRINITY_DN7387_c0_g1_i2.p1  ORF type:complete len:514 (+),score=113.13 TRINITY_DN7387_c0_g1_i2:163-1704(+)